MTGFELRISGFGSKRSANLATTTVRERTFVNPTNAVRIEFLNCPHMRDAFFKWRTNEF